MIKGYFENLINDLLEIIRAKPYYYAYLDAIITILDVNLKNFDINLINFQ